jgi:hypothetical protein
MLPKFAMQCESTSDPTHEVRKEYTRAILPCLRALRRTEGTKGGAAEQQWPFYMVAYGRWPVFFVNMFLVELI